jgi:hypothetical protein
MYKRGASESSSAAMYTRSGERTLLKEHLGLLHTRCLNTAAQSD